MFATSCFYIIKIRTKTHSEKSKIPRFYRLFKRFFLSPLVGRQPPAGSQARGARRGGRQSQGGVGGAHIKRTEKSRTHRVSKTIKERQPRPKRGYSRGICAANEVSADVRCRRTAVRENARAVRRNHNKPQLSLNPCLT